MPSTLFTHELTLATAPLGADNPLPVADTLLDPPYEISADLPPALQPGARIGFPRSMHPYLIQDDYSRQRSRRSVPAVVLDNGILRATFLPGVGGRLWSLVDVASGRDLVYANAALQPANFGLRNAWVAGGVEWNLGTKGHTEHTMSGLHAAQVAGPDGVPMLRMWEWDRLRSVVFQIDAWLPEGARGLHVYVRIVNPNAEAVPMYWWSNAAVPQSEDVRVLSPADRAYTTRYEGSVAEVPVPRVDGHDHTWPTAAPRPVDYFYALDGARFPWIAAVDGAGRGLAQASTARLGGRKLFCWGRSPGGRRWQEWLSPEGGQYLEIQAGLAATQFEHVLMPAGAAWDWLEVYGEVRADAAVAHGQDWDAAVAHTDQRVRELASPEHLDAALAQARACADLAPGAMLARGSGWGRLEHLARGHSGAGWVDETGTPFGPETLTEEQHPWVDLLEDTAAGSGGSSPGEAAARSAHRSDRPGDVGAGGGPLAGADPQEPPVSYVNGGFWRGRLETLAPSWLRDYHLGVLAQARADLGEAASWFASSHALTPNAWALRGSARVATEEGDLAGAANLLAQALELVPNLEPLVLEAIAASLQAGMAQQALTLVDDATGTVGGARHGRLRLLEATAALRTGDRSRAAAVLRSDIEIPDLREGDNALSDLWQEVFPGEPVPAHYDFRMV